MQCPFCKYKNTKVIETRSSEDGFLIKRRRMCENCGKRFTTEESFPLVVRKRGGRTELFDRQKVILGVKKSCQGRPISDEQMSALGLAVERKLRATGQAEIPSSEIGKAILEPLRDLDFVSYLRFASVYQEFETLDDFKKVIEDLEAYQQSKSEGKTGTDNAPAQTAGTGASAADASASEAHASDTRVTDSTVVDSTAADSTAADASADTAADDDSAEDNESRMSAPTAQ